MCQKYWYTADHWILIWTIAVHDIIDKEKSYASKLISDMKEVNLIFDFHDITFVTRSIVGDIFFVCFNFTKDIKGTFFVVSVISQSIIAQCRKSSFRYFFKLLIS